MLHKVSPKQKFHLLDVVLFLKEAQLRNMQRNFPQARNKIKPNICHSMQLKEDNIFHMKVEGGKVKLSCKKS